MPGIWGNIVGQAANTAREAVPGLKTFAHRTWNQTKALGATPVPGKALANTAIGTGVAGLGATMLTNPGHPAPTPSAAPAQPPGLVDQGIAKAKELAGSPQATQAVGGLKNYLSGFAQSPMKWGAGQWGGLGAGAVLAYLLSRKNDKEKDDQE